MSVEPIVRILAFLAALLLATRATGRASILASGVFSALALFGFHVRPLPSPLEAATLVLVLTLFHGLAFMTTWSPVVSEAAVSGALLAIPAGATVACVLRREPGWLIVSSVAAILAALSLFSAEASRANSEAGWRRGLMWPAAVFLPAGLAAVLVWMATAAIGPRWLAGAVGLLAALLVWLPAVWAEWRRMGRELDEEVRLGLLPLADAEVLRVPWRRRFEPRFGRADERREYIRSAQLLAVARQQQRRRTGEAERLRQLEVLAFRTRIRRTLDARSARYHTGSSDEFQRPGSIPEA
jgi:hypothetical protein